ncbi:hypothetical protein M3J09_013903 (mitochondrion) [Ascochyta lentis]
MEKKINSSCDYLLSKPHWLAKPYAFSSMPLQSGIFTINRKMSIGLVSSIITAAIGYGIRLILLKYLEYDVFTNLDNWIASLSYFCSLGGIRFVISECLKENTFLMSYCGGPMTVSNNTAGSGSLPVGSNAAGYNSSMQAPNNSGIGSSSAGDASITNDRYIIEKKLRKVQEKIEYFAEQVEGSKQDFSDIVSEQPLSGANGIIEKWNSRYANAVSALEDSENNLQSEIRMYNILQRKLANGDYNMSGTSAITKRSFGDSSMTNNDSSTPTNTKRTSNNQ